MNKNNVILLLGVIVTSVTLALFDYESSDKATFMSESGKTIAVNMDSLATLHSTPRNINSLFVTVNDDRYEAIAREFENFGGSPFVFGDAVYFTKNMRNGSYMFIEQVEELLEPDPKKLFEFISTHISEHYEFYGNRSEEVSTLMSQTLQKSLQHEVLVNLYCREYLCVAELKSDENAVKRTADYEALFDSGFCKLNYSASQAPSNILIINPNLCEVQNENTSILGT